MSNKMLLHETFFTLMQTITPQELIAQQCYLNDHILHIQESTYDLSRFQKVYLVGAGKAVIPMAQALQKILKERICSTLIVGAYDLDEELENTSYIKSSHPLPSLQSIEAAKAIQELMLTCKEDDLVIYLLSGGHSALVELPEAGITLSEFQEATQLMLRGGMPIEAMNCVRKHLSQVKGGKLARLCKAQAVVLVLSDVIGDDLHAIGSAPMYCDSTTFQEALSQLKTYRLLDKMPERIQTYLQEGYAHITHHLIGSNAIVLQRAHSLLSEAGVESSIIETPLEGYASDVAQELIGFVRSHQEQRHCYLFGGETTVKVTGEGRGGRNQHLCLSVLNLLNGEDDVTFLSAATDGIDGNSNAAGALIDLHSRIDAISGRMDPEHFLKRCDSTTFFEKTAELLITGPTHNNLLDIVMIYIEPKTTQGALHG
jgi:glycerate-2-kinase